MRRAAWVLTAAGLLLRPAAARAGADSQKSAEAIKAFADVAGVVDSGRLDKEELAELGRRYAQLGFTEAELQDAPRRAQELMDSVDEGAEELQRVNREVDRALAASDMAAYARLTSEREALRIRLSKDHDELTEIQKVLRSIWKRYEFTVVAGILTKKPSAQDLLAMERTKEFHGKVTKYYNKALDALSRDEALDKARRAELDRRHALRLRAALAAGALLVLVPAGAWAWRRRAYWWPGAPALDFDGDTLLGGVYRPEREVGRGAMGIVYEASDAALKRRVALKRVREELGRDARELELLLAEARTVAALKHPNIVEIYNVLREGPEVFLVFEFVDGADLAALLARTPRFPPAHAVSVTAQVAAAVDYAHQRRVVHRDLKPSNVMVSRDGKVKVMDFGIAHQAQKTVARVTHAQSWGTPAYMAPEQELGEVSGAADVYALAVMSYQMLTGTLPFPGPDFLAQKQGMRYRPAAAVVRGLPAAVDDALTRGLAPTPQGRFVSAGAFAAALKSAFGPAPLA